MFLRNKSLKRHFFLRITLLAFSMSLLLSFIASQSFLHGFDRSRQIHMRSAAKYAALDNDRRSEVLGYHIASSWEATPPAIRNVFASPPTATDRYLKHYEDWWYFAPPKKAYFVMRVATDDSQVRYVSYIKPPRPNSNKFRLQDPMVLIAICGSVAFSLFVLVLFYLSRSYRRPLKHFLGWAQSLELKELPAQSPDFKFQELNGLANVMLDSMASNANALKRERDFLGYASHELRNPIMTLMSNARLLRKAVPASNAKEQQIQDRISRASSTMKGIIETLLWLNRREDTTLISKPVQLSCLLDEVIDELDYMRDTKEIELTIDSANATRNLPEGAFRILVTNMVRNALQHTSEGHIHISQTDCSLTVSNPYFPEESTASTGFGLGMLLIQQISDKFGWSIEQTKSSRMFTITARF